MYKIQQILTNLFSFGPSKEDLLQIEREKEAQRLLKEKEEKRILEEKEAIRLKQIQELKEEKRKEKERLLSKKREEELEAEKQKLARLEKEKELIRIKEEKKKADILRRKELMAKEVLRLREEKETLEKRKKQKQIKLKNLEEERLKNKAKRIIKQKKEIGREKIEQKQKEVLKEVDEKNREFKKIPIVDKTLPVLIVEDCSLNQEILKNYFSQFDIETIIVSNGKDAMKKRIENDFSLIFMDIEMPLKNGIETAKEIFAFDTINKKDESVIIALIYKEDNIDSFLSIGIKEYLEKPINIDKLKKILLKYKII
jgi:CheY-like chemotaxis protein